MGIAKPCTYLHLAPPNSTHIHLPPSTSAQLILATTKLSAIPLTLLQPKCRMQLGNFPKFRPKTPKLFVLTENWQIYYLGGVDSGSRLRFLKFLPQNPFFCKFGLKKSKLSLLAENWHT